MKKITHKKFFVFTLIIYSLTIFASEPGPMKIETAQPDEGWAQKHIQKAYIKNISPDINIQKDFKPSRPLTRGELAVMISRVLPSNIEGEECRTEEYNAVRYYRDQAPVNFSDFRYWDSFGYVERIIKRNIMPPVEERFNPNEKITRGEFLKTLLILLEKTQDPFAKIDNIAADAVRLNQHLTEIRDVSVTPQKYAGWLKMAQEYNILPHKDEAGDIVSSSLSIPYKEVFYNFTTRRYEFQPNQPINRELAVAIFSNLFIKWDGYGDYIPYNASIGNSSKNVVLKTINGKTKVDAELIDYNTMSQELTIRYQKRKTEYRQGKIFNTVYIPGESTYKVADNAFIWVKLNDRSIQVKGDNPVERLSSVLDRLKDENIFDIKVNYLLLPEKHGYNVNKKILQSSDESYQKRKIIGYIEVNLIPYDYIGRVVSRDLNEITIYDEKKGNISFKISESVKINREIISVDGSSGTLTEKIVNRAEPENIKEGEQIKLKIGRDEKVTYITSKLLRIGVPSNVDVNDGFIKTQYLVGKHYKTADDSWNPETRSGLKVYGFDYDYPGKWRKGGLEVLFSEATMLRSVDLYVQPAEAKALDDNTRAPYEDRIYYIEAIPRNR
ncbi:MAG: S-layer homology domain-containing protein [Candidatus Muiribacteriota bacterium]